MINLKNVYFKYQGSSEFTLSNISLEVPENKYTTIVGHNGSGKSTLSKLITGLFKPTKGEVFVGDTLITKETLKLMRSLVGIIFQNPENQFIGSTVEDDIAFGLENKLLTREEMKILVEKFSKMVGVDKLLSREPHTLSGGQKQRVAIASILAMDPKVIVFDEVTSMLDPKGRSDVLGIMKEIQLKKETTLISITHDMNEAAQSDHIIVMAHGEIIAQGDPKKILNREDILKEANLKKPFIYELACQIKNVKKTFDEENLLKELWK